MSVFLDNGFIDYANLNAERLKNAFENALADAYAAVSELECTNTPPTFENTVQKLEYIKTPSKILASLSNAMSSADNQQYSDVNAAIQSAFKKLVLQIGQNPVLYERTKAAAKNQTQLDAQDKILLGRTLASFERSGIGLPPLDKAEFIENQMKIESLTNQYKDNILAHVKNCPLVLTDAQDLSGLPESRIAEARANAQTHGLPEGALRFVLNRDVVNDFLDYAHNRTLREAAYKTAFHHSEDDPNWEVLTQIANIRLRQANLLGYIDYATYKLDYNRLAKSPNEVIFMNEQVVDAAKPAAQNDMALFASMAKSDGVSQIMPWDWRYYRLRRLANSANVDAQKIKDYAEFETILSGLFNHVQQFMGWQINHRPDMPTIADDVRVYEIRDTQDEQIAWVVFDLFKRPGVKKDGAWVSPIRSHFIDEQGKKHLPIYGFSANYTKGNDGDFTYLSIPNIVTMFHEMGHVKDGVSGTAKYESLSAFSGPWDAVEIASRFTEGFWQTPEFVKTYMVNPRNGESLPISYLQDLITTQSAMQSTELMRQMWLIRADIMVHTIKDPVTTDTLKSMYQTLSDKFTLWPHPMNDMASLQFQHAFVGAYDMGYYAYAWSDMYAFDLFDTHKNQGLYNSALNAKFRDTVLGKTPVLDINQSYAQISGRKKASVTPLLRRYGIENA